MLDTDTPEMDMDLYVMNCSETTALLVDWNSFESVPKEIGSEQIPKTTIAALGKMPGSEGNHGSSLLQLRFYVTNDSFNVSY